MQFSVRRAWPNRTTCLALAGINFAKRANKKINDRRANQVSNAIQAQIYSRSSFFSVELFCQAVAVAVAAYNLGATNYFQCSLSN